MSPLPLVEPPWWRPAKASGRRRQPLTRDAIVEAALKILDAEGANALTVRRLGEELGTGSATLYWHIGGKDELGELVYDHVMGEVELPNPIRPAGRSSARTSARQVYRIMLNTTTWRDSRSDTCRSGPTCCGSSSGTWGCCAPPASPTKRWRYFGDIFGRYLDASVLEVTSRVDRRSNRSARTSRAFRPTGSRTSPR